MPNIVFDHDRISQITYLLDDVFYKSSIKDLRKYYFNNTKDLTHWLILSDYYFGDDATNKVIAFSIMPYFMDILELQSQIKQVAPKDIKHTRTINEEFIKLLNSIPIASFAFVFPQKKYWVWDSKEEMQAWLMDDITKINAYTTYWKHTEPENKKRLNQLSKSMRCLERLLRGEKKLKLMTPLYFVSLLGGYIGSLVCRESALSTLVWLSDRDSTNEICFNAVRELFQITLINITKRNIEFAFTRANSDSDEWYEELTRIPDYLTGTISNFDFTEWQANKDKFASVARLHLKGNFQNTFIYRFVTDPERIKVQRMVIL